MDDFTVFSITLIGLSVAMVALGLLGAYLAQSK
jgi:hypothetical protein